MRTLTFAVTLCVVLSRQKEASGLPLPGPERRPSLTQRSNGTPDCEGLVEEVGDRGKLPPWAMGWLMPKGSFVSVFRFHTRRQVESCASGTEFVVRKWDSRSGTWKEM